MYWNERNFYACIFMFVLFQGTHVLVGEFYELFKLYGDDTVDCVLRKSQMIFLWTWQVPDLEESLTVYQQ